MPNDTPLHKACHNGELDNVKKLLESGEYDVNESGAGDRRPLHRAAGSNHVEVCRYLIEKGAKIDQPDKSGRTALHWAAISGHREAAELLVEKGANLMATTSSAMTPMHGAAEGGRVEVIRLFLEKAPSKDDLCNARDADGKTPFDLAVQNKHNAVCKLLKEMGDPNAQSAACLVM